MEETMEFLSSTNFMIFSVFIIGFLCDIYRKTYDLNKVLTLLAWLITGTIYAVCFIFILPFIPLKIRPYISIILILIIFTLIIMNLISKFR